MRFLLLAVNFFIQGFKKIFSLIPFNPGRGIPSKKSSLRLVDDEIFLTHWVKSCLMIYNKCIVIYYKIVGEGIPSKKSSRRLVAHETKIYFFEGTLLGVHHQKNVLVVSLPTRQRDISLRVNYFCRLIVSGTKITYNKSLPVNFVRMFKINTRKLWQKKNK